MAGQGTNRLYDAPGVAVSATPKYRSFSDGKIRRGAIYYSYYLNTKDEGEETPSEGLKECF